MELPREATAQVDPALACPAASTQPGMREGAFSGTALNVCGWFWKSMASFYFRACKSCCILEVVMYTVTFSGRSVLFTCLCPCVRCLVIVHLCSLPSKEAAELCCLFYFITFPSTSKIKELSFSVFQRFCFIGLFFPPTGKLIKTMDAFYAKSQPFTGSSGPQVQTGACSIKGPVHGVSTQCLLTPGPCSVLRGGHRPHTLPGP